MPIDALKSSQSVIYDGNRTGALNNRPIKRKRNRQKVACQPCQRRKTRCNKVDPCEACTKRDDNCVWDSPAIGQASEFSVLQRKIRSLERELLESRAAQQISVNGVTPSLRSQIRPPSIQDDLGPFDREFFPCGLSNESSSSTFSPVELSMPSPPIRAIQPDNSAKSSPKSDTLIDYETEDALQSLEELALGRKQYRMLGLSADVPCVGTLTFEENMSQSHEEPRTGALTTILTPLTYTGPNIFAVNGNDEILDLLRAIPQKNISDFLVSEFFPEIAWMYNVLHMPTFLAECEELWSTIWTQESSRIDPAWLSTYFMVLVWAISSLDPRKSYSCLSAISDTEIQTMLSTWMSASHKALDTAKWSSKPQARCIQSILLRLSYHRANSKTDKDGADGSSFFIWLAAAVRMCEVMELHKLGRDPRNMPRDDPAWPSRPCSLKRELAKKLWTFCISYDSIFCASTYVGRIAMHKFFNESDTTDAPTQVDDEDLGLQMFLQEKPLTHLTDVSFLTTVLSMARFQALALDMYKQDCTPDYASIMQLDAGLQREITRLQIVHEGSNPRRRPYHRSLLLCMLHNRVLRLHRPFFRKGNQDKVYEPSYLACLRSASEICAGLTMMANAYLEHLWWIWSYGIGAAVVLFMSIILKEQAGFSEQQLAFERDSILSLRMFYERNAENGVSCTIRQISEKALRVVNLLVAPRPKEVEDNSQPAESLASVVRDIVDKLKASSATTESFSQSITWPLHDSSLDIENLMATFDYPSIFAPSSDMSSSGALVTDEFDAAASRQALMDFGVSNF